MNASLDEKLKNVRWGEYRLGALFNIDRTLSFNSDSLVDGTGYDYVTRTSTNQGILQTTGFVNKENINDAGTWSLGLLSMDFFYRRKPWYAGQFVRKITPKISIPEKAIPYFSTVLNKQKPTLLSFLVRSVDKAFRSISVKLPQTADGKIDFAFMESLIAALEAERITELAAYLKASGLDNYELSKEEETAIAEYEKTDFKVYNLTDIFDVKNTSNVLSRDIVENSGTVPYLCASTEDNSVSTYISFDKKYIERGNCIFIGGKTFSVSYQEKDFYSNDSHNLALYLKRSEVSTKNIQLYLVACIYKSLAHEYSWGDSVSNSKIQTDKLTLPEKNGKPDYASIELLISAIQKLVIKDVVHYTEKRVDAAEESPLDQ